MQKNFYAKDMWSFLTRITTKKKEHYVLLLQLMNLCGEKVSWVCTGVTEQSILYNKAACNKREVAWSEIILSQQSFLLFQLIKW